MQSEFVHLHTHSRFSVRDGLPSPLHLVEYAKMSGHDAIALTDHGSMGGHYQFAKAAAATEAKDGRQIGVIKPIFGIEAYVCDDITVRTSIEVIDPDGGKRTRRPKHRHVVFLAKNEVGYGNLLEMMSISTDPETGYYSEPRVDWGIIEGHHEGLVCMSACLAGEVSRFIRDGDMANAREMADRYRQLFGDDFYLEVQHHGMADERDCYAGIEEIADGLGIPLVASNDVHYTLRSDAATHALLVAMRFMKSEEQGGSSDTRNLRDAYKASEFYLKDAEQMAELFSRRPEALAHTLEIAEKCEYEYPLAHSIIWPKYEVPADRMSEIAEQRRRVPEHSEKQTLLIMRVKEGLRRLGLYGAREYGEQAKMELDVIFDLGYEDYFLVQDLICDRVREAKIAMGPGRGSGAGSVVLYALGVTKIDPIKNGLIFERFLNPGRGPQFDHRLAIQEFERPEPKVPANMERDPSVRDQTLGRADW